MKIRLDEAIDQVAARMTAVAEDDELAARIVSALPQRLPWSWQWLLPRLAGGVLAALTLAVVLRPFYERSTDVPQQARSTVPVEAGHHRVAVEVAHDRVSAESAFRRTSSPVVDRPDHEFSLPAIAATTALDIDALGPASLPEDARLTIESLRIADLPLTDDFSPQQ